MSICGRSRASYDTVSRTFYSHCVCCCSRSSFSLNIFRILLRTFCVFADLHTFTPKAIVWWLLLSSLFVRRPELRVLDSCRMEMTVWVELLYTHRNHDIIRLFLVKVRCCFCCCCCWWFRLSPCALCCCLFDNKKKLSFFFRLLVVNHIDWRNLFRSIWSIRTCYLLNNCVRMEHNERRK